MALITNPFNLLQALILLHIMRTFVQGGSSEALVTDNLCYLRVQGVTNIRLVEF